MYLDLSLPLSTWSGAGWSQTSPTSAVNSSPPWPRSRGDQAQQSVHQSPSGPTIARNIRDGVVPACVGPLECDAGWSSLVARRAHNPKVAGSIPAGHYLTLTGTLTWA